MGNKNNSLGRTVLWLKSRILPKTRAVLLATGAFCLFALVIMASFSGQALASLFNWQPVLTVFSSENVSQASIFYQKADKLRVSNTGVDLEFQGIKSKPQKVLVQVSTPDNIESPYEIRTDVVFVDPASVSFEKTKVSLAKRKDGVVNAVVICNDENFNALTNECSDWDIAPVALRDLNNRIVFETTHFSAVAGAYLNLIDKHADLTVGDIWNNRFQTYGTSDLVIKTVDGTHFGIDLGFEGVFCGENFVGGAQHPDSDTVLISNYSCDGKVSSVKNKELTSGRHWLSFSFGETQDERSHNFACNTGTLNDTCTVTAGNTAANGETISGSGNLVIASGGSITAAAGSGANPGNSFTITMTGNVTIQSGGTITGNVTINAANVDVQSGGTLNVNGKGYLGGCETGCGASFQDGYGPGGGDTYNAGGGGGGASHGGNGGTGFLASPAPYGSITQPNQVGSGGGGYQGSIRGGSGGGTIKIVATGTVTVNGTVSANGDNGGGSCCSGGGSGGSIWIDAGTLAGNAAITANGGNWHSNVYGGGGAGGRIALYYTSTTHSGTVSAYGGDGSNGGVAASKGGAGTIYRKLASATNGDLIVINSLGGQNTTQVASSNFTFDNVTIGNNALYVIPTGTTMAIASSLAGGASSGTLTINSGGTLNITSTSFSLSTPLILLNSGTFTATNLNLTIASGGTLTMSGTANISLAGLTIQSGGNLKHTGNTTTRANALDITASGDINIQSGGSINLNGLGHTGGGATGGTAGNGTGRSLGQNAVVGTGGAGYGGTGGNGSGTTGGITYGSNIQPTDLGSGAGTAANGYNGGDGGGAVKLNAGGTLTVAGSITANGTNGTFGGGGGSGGSIWLLGSTIAGNGTLTANGGNGGTGAGASGGGGGGRIALYYGTKTYSGTPTASAGTGVNQAGNTGTVYEETPPTTAITAVCSVGGNNCTAGGSGQSPQVAFGVTSLAGTAAAGASALSSVQISIKDTTSNQWYGGSSFNQGSEYWITATGTTTWSYNTSSITWTPNRNYLVRTRGISANSWTGPVQSLNFIFATPPSVTNVSASQNSSGVVSVGYDVAYSDGPSTTISLYYNSAATLSSTIDGDDTPITVSSGTFFPNAGTILIDSELITYTSKSGNTLQGTVTRGALSSIGVSHNSGATVWLLASAVTGDVGTVTNGTGKTIAWTAATNINGHSSATYRVTVVASQGGIGAGQSGTFNFDTLNPILSGSASSVRATATSSTAVNITWTTDESSNSNVDYGTTVAYGTTATNNTLGTSHSVSLTGLTASTAYYFRIRSTDAANNTLTDDNGGASYTFTTPASDASSPRPIDQTPPVITNIQVINIATNGVTVIWTTDEESSSIVNYGLTNTYGSLAGVPDIFVTSHQVTVSGLIPGTVYNYQVVSLDRNSNRTASVNATFTTATGTGSGTGDGTGSGASADVLEEQVNDLTNANVALNTQINELNAKLGSAISEDEAGRIRRDLDNLRTEIDNNIRKISELNKFRVENEGLRAEVAKLRQEMSDFTSKILGLKEGESLSPGDLLKVVSRKFNELARVFKLQSTVEEREQIEDELTDTTNTLKELTELVPPPRVMTRPAIEVTSATATINWTTDKATFGSVLYGDDATFKANRSYVSQANDTNGLGTSHLITLTGLAPATLYHYQIVAKSEAGAETNSADFTFTTKTASPIISDGRVVRVNDSTIQVLWQTTLPSNSVVTYTPYLNGTLDGTQALAEGKPELAVNHNVTVADLKPATTYDIEISSTDAFGNTVTDRLGRFVTSEDKALPVISQVRTEISVIPGSQNRVQVIISWKTDEPATTQVFYSPGAAAGAAAEQLKQASNLNDELTFNHIAVITNWEPGTIYRFRAVSKDETGNSGESKTFTVLTPRQKATVVDLIIDNFTDIFGWTKGSR